MKVIITGASGFVGKNLSRYLVSWSYDVNEISLRNLNWKDSIAADVIIHLAGKAHDIKNISEESEYFKINTDLTKELFDVFLESDVRDFIYFSSVKAAADEVGDILFEDFQPNPKTPYGESKLQAEKYILSKELPINKRVFIIRPCMIHGPGNKGNLNLLYNVVKNRVPYPLAAFQNERSFLGIDNLNYLIREIIEMIQIPSGIYNFADDEFLSTNDLVKLIATVSNKRSLLLRVPEFIVNAAARFGDILNLPLNTESVQKLTENYRVSNKAIKEAIGIEKLPFTVQEGLQKTIKSFTE